MSSDHWIEDAHLRHGGLHKALKISESHNIPRSKIEHAAASGNPHLAKMARAAETLGKLRKRHGDNA